MYRLALTALVALAPFAASAQQPTAPQNQRQITRDQFVQRAAEMAGRRFDAIDTAHAGVITRAQLRAWRQSHGGARMGGRATE